MLFKETFEQINKAHTIMKRIIIILPCCLFLLTASAQRKKEIGIAITNSNTAFPFSKFSSLFSGVFHPGIELNYGFNWKSKKKHDWVQNIKVSYFYHRFMQHGISLYTDLGYRYKFTQHISADAAMGFGYMHSIPATAVLKLNDEGEYENGKGIGRAQAIAPFTLGIGYTVHPSSERPIKLFAQYQQKLQFPFVKEYVPLLPYNNLIIGISRPLGKK